ncbi:ubiquinone biosynthesis protein UbiH [Marinobacter sp. Z-F4-2]|nr:ubiquinone biosynthesis protein UbiH [Marinobacter sp. Z-F4-2]
MANSILVVGGGLIGLSTAIGLREQGHQVTLIERAPVPSYTDQPELRVSALAQHSRQLLQQLQVWDQLPRERLGPYTGMEVWDQDSFGRIEFNAAEVNADDLGAIVENRVIETKLWERAQAVGVQLHPETAITELQQTATQVQIKTAGGQTYQADYLVAADGVQSQIRQKVQAPLTFWDYEQRGMVAVIDCEKPHGAVARQVFLPSGPVALLPLGNPKQVSLVWSCDDDQVSSYEALDDQAFAQQLTRVSDGCLGTLTVASKRASFPLRMHYAQRWLHDRVILIGDAAHSIHPLAGQGANLGFADVTALLKVFNEETVSHRDLRAWERERKAAAVVMITAMEAFKRGFGTAHPAAKLLRGLGLHLANRISPLKRSLTQVALGS